MGSWTSYTPQLFGLTTNPNLGASGTQVGRYIRMGDGVGGNPLIVASFRVGFFGTGKSNGLGVFGMSLPFPATRTYFGLDNPVGIAHAARGFQATPHLLYAILADSVSANYLPDQTMWFVLPEVVQTGTATVLAGTTSIQVPYNVPLTAAGVPFDWATPGDINVTPIESWDTSGMKMFWLSDVASPAGTFRINAAKATGGVLSADQDFAWKVHVKPGFFPFVSSTMPFGGWLADGFGIQGIVVYEAAAS